MKTAEGSRGSAWVQHTQTRWHPPQGRLRAAGMPSRNWGQGPVTPAPNAEKEKAEPGGAGSRREHKASCSAPAIMLLDKPKGSCMLFPLPLMNHLMPMRSLWSCPPGPDQLLFWSLSPCKSLTAKLSNCAAGSAPFPSKTPRVLLLFPTPCLLPDSLLLPALTPTQAHNRDVT